MERKYLGNEQTSFDSLLIGAGKGHGGTKLLVESGLTP